MTAVTMSGKNASIVLERIISVTFVRSCTAIYPTTEVIFTRDMNSPFRTGMKWTAAWGKTTFQKAWEGVYPRAAAASDCPAGTASIPLRIISDEYAPKLMEKPITATTIPGIFTLPKTT